MNMRKIINKPENFVEDTMDGIIRAYGDRFYFLDNDHRILLNNMPHREGKVGIVTAEGSGHMPLFLGYVGQGMLDGCTVGNVFASPSAEKMANTIRACDYGQGVLCMYGNYGGDRMNLALAILRNSASILRQCARISCGYWHFSQGAVSPIQLSLLRIRLSNSFPLWLSTRMPQILVVPISSPIVFMSAS